MEGNNEKITKQNFFKLKKKKEEIKKKMYKIENKDIALVYQI